MGGFTITSPAIITTAIAITITITITEHRNRQNPITAAKNPITAAKNPITAATAAKNPITAAIIFYRSFLPTSGCYEMCPWVPGAPPGPPSCSKPKGKMINAQQIKIQLQQLEIQLQHLNI